MPVKLPDAVHSSSCLKPIFNTVPTEIVPIPRAVIVPPLTRVTVPPTMLVIAETVPPARLVTASTVPVKGELNPSAPLSIFTRG